MIRLNFILILISFILACKSSKELNKPHASFAKKMVELKSLNEVKQGGSIEFEFVNNSKKTIIVVQPSKKNIEKFENNIWRRVRILYCPCGADCTPLPKVKYLEPDEKHKYNWKLIEP